MDWVEKLAAFTFSGMILANAFIVRMAVGAWLFPACLFSLFWFLMTFVPLSLGWFVPVNPWAVGYIAAVCAAFSAGALGYRWRELFRRNPKPDPAQVFVNGFMRTIIYTASALAAASTLAHILAQGISLQDLVSNPIGSAAKFASSRYAGQLDLTFFSRIGLVCAYICVLVGGLYFGAAGRSYPKAGILIASFIPAIMVMVLQSAKGLLFLSITLFLGGVLVSRIYRSNYIVASRRDLLNAARAIVVLLPLTTLSFMSRGVFENENVGYAIAKLQRYLFSYSSGHLFAFADWFSYRTGRLSVLEYSDDSPTYGFFSFMAAFRFFGDDRKVPMGTYADYYWYEDILRTNIFTAFRGAIVDFGLIGSLFFALLAGACVHLVYYCLLKSRNPNISIAGFVLSCGACYMTFSISIFTWDVIPAAFTLFAAILWVNSRHFRFGVVTVGRRVTPRVGPRMPLRVWSIMK